MTNDLLRAALRLAIDYLRWTQLVPMLAVWGFLLACVLVAAFAAFESQGIAVLEFTVGVFAAFAALLPESIVPRTADGTIRLSGDDLLNVLLLAWFIVSLAAMALSSLIGSRLRPSYLETLGGRLKTCAIAAAAVCTIFFTLYATAPEKFNAPLTSALPLFLGGPAITLVVSAWSLTISAVLGSLHELIDGSYSGSREE